MDGELLVNETSFPSSGQKKIERKEYNIPSSMLEAKDKITLTFRSQSAPAARVFDIRLVRD